MIIMCFGCTIKRYINASFIHKIMTIFIFTHFGLNICHTFLYFVTLKCFVFMIEKLVWLKLSVMLKQLAK